jgi:hypothetical protein
MGCLMTKNSINSTNNIPIRVIPTPTGEELEKELIAGLNAQYKYYISDCERNVPEPDYLKTAKREYFNNIFDVLKKYEEEKGELRKKRDEGNIDEQSNPKNDEMAKNNTASVITKDIDIMYESMILNQEENEYFFQ